MASVAAPLYAFNGGEVCTRSLARIDLSKMRMAAEEQTNFLPMVLGPMMMRPGLEYLERTKDDAVANLVPFVFNVDTTAILEMTANAMRVFLPDDGAFLTRPAVSATVTNGEFATDLTGWSDVDEPGASSTHSAGALLLQGTGVNFAARGQQVTVSEAGVEHALVVHVTRGEAVFRVGSTAAADDYVAQTTLRPGVHNIAFAPVGDFHIWVGASTPYPTLVDAITMATAGVVSLATPWEAGDLGNLRSAQSADVLFVADGAHRQRRIERRSQRSWSIVDYAPLDGPFRIVSDGAITLTPSALDGTATLTASRAIFDAGHVGALFRLTHSGQVARGVIAGDDQATSSVEIKGVGDSRQFGIVTSGTWTGTITLQRSFGVEGAWEDVETYTTNQAKTLNDGFDNSIVFYRLIFKSGDYSSGAATGRLTFSQGSQSGVCRISAVTNGTTAAVDVLQGFSRTEATATWSEGAWSDARGYPSAVVFHDGRLFWGKSDRVFGSVSDAYESFDDTVEGDSGPIQRTIATGGVEGIYWLASLQRLLAGTGGQEVSIRASGFDEPLTPTQFTARAASSRGSARLPAAIVDNVALFVSRNARRLYALAYDAARADYASSDMTRLHPGVMTTGVVRMGVQRTPDPVVWCVLEDGDAVAFTYEPADDVMAFSRVKTAGKVEDVCVLPGAAEDRVFFVVQRTIDGQSVRFIERMALRDDARGGLSSRTVDAFVAYSGGLTTSVIGLDHLEGEDLVVWADGAPLDGTFRVLNGQIIIPAAAYEIVAGLPYEARFKSTKLAYGAERGTALSFPKRVNTVSLLMSDVAWRGVRIGRNFTDMTRLPHTFRGAPLAADEVLANYDFQGAPFNGGWDADSRLCIKVASPYCATLLGAVVNMETNERDIRPGRVA